MDPRLLGLIDTAIQREEDAYAFYMEHSRKGQRPGGARDHRMDRRRGAEAQSVSGEIPQRRISERSGLRLSDVVYYKIAEHQEEPEVTEDMNSSQVYLVAAHRELRSHQFYTALANQHAAGEAREMLLRMANEELKHKEKMEYLYANTAFPQTSGG
ncbi:MAG: hypothetical protein MZV70_08985 [Desulfobacterales bacterium]|nr:hypothetical protein [Desulfobacterales bacterium]